MLNGFCTRISTKSRVHSSPNSIAAANAQNGVVKLAIANGVTTLRGLRRGVKNA
jgi:hypothetical protein